MIDSQAARSPAKPLDYATPPTDATLRDARLRGRFLFIDGLRGVAALAVALFHFQHPWQALDIQPQLNASLPLWARDGAHFLEYGVEVFFVLSGFVIAHSLWGQRITPRFAGNFALRRSLRLDPPYWILIAFCVGWPYLVFPTMLDGFFARVGGWTGIAVNAIYLPDLIWWRSIVPVPWTPRIVGVGWSLCLEVQFYLAYIGLLAISQLAFDRLSRRAARPIVGATFGALAIYSLCRWYAHVNVERYDDFGSRWYMFFAGALLYATVAGRVAWGWLAAFVIAVLAAGVAYREPRSATAMLTTVAIYVAAKTGGLQTWLSWRWLQHLGRLSYSFYLVHLPLGTASIVAIAKFSDGSIVSAYTAIGFALTVSLLAAELLHRAVEAPAMRLSSRFKPAKVRREEMAMATVLTAPSDAQGTPPSAASSARSSGSTPASRTSAARPGS